MQVSDQINDPAALPRFPLQMGLGRCYEEKVSLIPARRAWHAPESPEECDSPDQAAHYHILRAETWLPRESGGLVTLQGPDPSVCTTYVS
jgi:hypothetical protein